MQNKASYSIPGPDNNIKSSSKRAHTVLSAVSMESSMNRMNELFSSFKKLNPTSPTAEATYDCSVRSSTSTNSDVALYGCFEKLGKLVSLYIGDLDPNVTEDMLYKHFGGFKSLSSVKICCAPGTGLSLGYGYLNFGSKEDANRARKELNCTKLLSKEVRIMPAIKDKEKPFLATNVFISNLNTEVIHSLRDFYEYFSGYGEIWSCKLDLKKRQGFVSFQDRYTAEKFVESMNDHVFHGSRIFCSIHIPKSKRQANQTHCLPSSPELTLTRSSPINSALTCNKDTVSPVSSDIKDSASGFNQVYIKGLPSNLSVDLIRALVEKYAEIENIYTAHPAQYSSLWAIVTLKNKYDGPKVAQHLHRTLFNGNRLVCVRALTREERQRQLDSEQTSSLFPRAPQSKTFKVHLYNLAPQTTENFFKMFLKSYTFEGSILKYYICATSKESNSSYIEFTSEDDAKTILNKLDGVTIADYKIRASLSELSDQEIASLQKENSSSLQPCDVEKENLKKLTNNRITTFQDRQQKFYINPSGPSYPLAFGQGYPFIPLSLQQPNGLKGTTSFPPMSQDTRIKYDFANSIPVPVETIEYLESWLERIIPSYVDFLKYPGATRPRNIKIIVRYLVDSYWRHDPVTIKRDLVSISAKNPEAEIMFREKLVQAMEYFGFSR